jgi:transcriptional regulator with XRE-family HTH domain
MDPVLQSVQKLAQAQPESDADLALLAGVTRQTIWQLRKGLLNDNMRFVTVKRIAEACGRRLILTAGKQ